MKVVSSKQMSNMEAQAYRDGSSETDFMEEAGSGVALVVHDYAERFQLDKQIVLLCGKGNNAGDAYVAGIHLIHLDYEVISIQIASLEECSHLCKENYRRFLAEGGRIRHFSTFEDLAFPMHGIIVDGIFGTGFRGEVEEPYSTIIDFANRSGIPIIAVDIPSGLDGESGKASRACIKATETAFLGLPKNGFFLSDGWNHVGHLRYVDFGLPSTYIQESEADYLMLTKEDLYPKLPTLVRNRHKYQAGYVVGWAGSPQMPGAALLASQAALRGGAGMMRLLYPAGMENLLVSGAVEIIKTAYDPHDPRSLVEWLSKATALFVGPGLGRDRETMTLLKELLPSFQHPSVIDADALFFLSETDVEIPANAVLTPHLGELVRLMKIPAPLEGVDKEFLSKIQRWVEERNVTLVLKGGPSFIFHPREPIAISPAGDPGMATAGSGDVLTGLIAALLAQGLKPYTAACMGVYIHGLAGEHAALEMTSYCMTATDIVFYFPEGFRLIEV